MSALIHLKVAYKLALAFACCLALSIAGGVVAIQRMTIMNERAGLIVTEALAGSAAIADLRADFRQVRNLQLRPMIA